MIILIGAEKGGTGKTVIAVNLAAARALQDKKVVIVDTDKQNTALRWVSQRDKNPDLPQKIDCLPLLGEDIGQKIVTLTDRYDDIIIDTRGSDAVELRASLIVADYFLTPIQGKQFDLWTIEHIETLYHRARGFNEKLRGGIVINLAKSRSIDTKIAIEELQKLKFLPFSGVVIEDRNIYHRCQPLGGSVFEYKHKDEKAEAEIIALHKVIYNDNEETTRNILQTIHSNAKRSE